MIKYKHLKRRTILHKNWGLSYEHNESVSVLLYTSHPVVKLGSRRVASGTSRGATEEQG